MTGRPTTAGSRPEVVRVTSRAELELCWDVRMEVFVGEQQVPIEEEVDDLDTAATTSHVLALDGARRLGLGTGRLLSDPDHPGEVHLGRIAVRAAARGTGLGSRIVVALEAVALAEHAIAPAEDRHALRVRVELAAQESAIPFYERLGYGVVSGQRFLDAGIWHQDMARTITLAHTPGAPFGQAPSAT